MGFFFGNASCAERVISAGLRACLLPLRPTTVRIINDNRFVSLNTAERMVYRGEALFVFTGPEGKRELRYLDEHESRLLRRAIADESQRARDNAMIESGRRVVYWNGDGDPVARMVPGMVRS